VPSFHLGVGPEDNPSPADYISVRFYGNIGLRCHGILTVICWNKLNKYVFRVYEIFYIPQISVLYWVPLPQ
jgi:hypothetical protein